MSAYDKSTFSEIAAAKGNNLSDEAIQRLVADSSSFIDEVTDSFGNSLSSTAVSGVVGEYIKNSVSNCISDCFKSLLDGMKAYLEGRVDLQAKQTAGADEMQQTVATATKTDVTYTTK